MTTHEVTASDGRTLAVTDAGVAGGPVLLSQHGSPGSGRLYRTEIEGAERLGARLLAYDRPGYGGSTPHPGRGVADAVEDVAAILDALGAERFATYGWSGGGPHALACAALLEGRCAAAATIAGVAPSDQPDLEFTAGMGEGNVEEFGRARQGRVPLAAMLRREAESLASVTADQLAEAMAPHLSGPDAGALTGELAEHLHGMILGGLAPGIRRLARRRPRVREAMGFRRREDRRPRVDLAGRRRPDGPRRPRPLAGGPRRRRRVAAAARRGPPHPVANRIGDIQEWLAGHLR